MIEGVFVLFYQNDMEKPLFLSSAYDLNKYGFLTRGKVKEFLHMIVRNTVPLVDNGSRASVEYEGKELKIIRWTDGLAMAMVTGAGYPARVAYTCLNEAREMFLSKVEYTKWTSQTKDWKLTSFNSDFELLREKYSNPSVVAPLARAQSSVNDALFETNNALKKLLQNQEDLDHLVATSEDLSTSAKITYDLAKDMRKQQQCCSLY